MTRNAAAAAGRAFLAVLAAAALLLPAGCTEPPAQQATQTGADAPAGPAPESVPAPSPEDLGVTPASPNALYARIGLAEDAARAMVVMLDESGGADSGFDTLYADTDLDGRLTSEGEKLEATDSRDYGDVSIAQFPPIDLAAENAGLDRGRLLGLSYMGGRDQHSLRATVGLAPSEGAGDDMPTAMLMGEPALAATPGEAAVWRAFGEPVLEMQTQPLGRTLCVALTAKLGDAELYAREAEVDLVIRTPEGEVLTRDHGYLGDFGFG